MPFRISGLSPTLFRQLFGLSDEELARHRAKRYVANQKPGYPDRIELRDAEAAETVILVNYIHQPADNPYARAMRFLCLRVPKPHTTAQMRSRTRCA